MCIRDRCREDFVVGLSEVFCRICVKRTLQETFKGGNELTACRSQRNRLTGSTCNDFNRRRLNVRLSKVTIIVHFWVNWRTVNTLIDTRSISFLIWRSGIVVTKNSYLRRSSAALFSFQKWVEFCYDGLIDRRVVQWKQITRKPIYF